MGYDSIHETVIADILDTIHDGIELGDEITSIAPADIRTSGSLARATSGLTLVFPVICTTTLPIETASMIAKAIERKNVALLQMAFSAYNITNATDAVQHLAKFHTNLGTGRIDLEKFMDAMDSLGESSTMLYSSAVRAVTEDCKRNLNFVLEDSVNPTPLLEYSEVSRYGSPRIIHEAKKHDRYDYDSYIELPEVDVLKARRDKNGNIEKDADGKPIYDVVGQTTLSKDEIEQIAFGNGIGRKTSATASDMREWLKQNSAAEKNYVEKQQNADKLDLTASQAKKDREAAKERNDDTIAAADARSAAELKQREKESKRKQRFDTYWNRQNYEQRERQHDEKMLQQASRDRFAAVSNQLVSSDVKKANEMQPSLMIVQFYVNDKDRDLNIAQQVVAGVKSKLYPADPMDITYKILSHNADSDFLMKIIKVGTREISFVKDFLLGIDNAKLETLARSRRGSNMGIFKALERRAIRGKVRKALRMNNIAKAISTLVISSEEAEELKKVENVDVMQPRVIIPIMQRLNLLYFVVVDTVAESVSMLTDGETSYEVYSFTSLERENGDGAYKKVVNLMTKLA